MSKIIRVVMQKKIALLAQTQNINLIHKIKNVIV